MKKLIQMKDALKGLTPEELELLDKMVEEFIKSDVGNTRIILECEGYDLEEIDKWASDAANDIGKHIEAKQ